MLVLANIAGFIICLIIINDITGFGFLGIVIGLFVFPIIIAVVPWYALIAYGSILPLALIYGGAVIAAMIWGIGSAISGDQ